ncbi:MAG: S8 family serine peptidase [Coriobacteriales bacterium]|nr:S8 family serine peptidase [Coriobacteriales bacterium]
MTTPRGRIWPTMTAFVLALVLATAAFVTRAQAELNEYDPAPEQYTGDEEGQALAPEEFVMPQDTACEQEAVLVSVSEDDTEQAREAILAQGVATEVEEVVPGTLRVVANSDDIEQVANDFLDEGVVDAVQPNYLYEVAEQGTEEVNVLEGDAAQQGETGGQTDQDTQEVQVTDEGTQQPDAVVVEEDAAPDALSAQSVVTEDGQGDGVALTTAANTNDTLVGEQWALDSIRIEQAWGIAKANHAVTVAVLDAGCMVSHEDLKANIVDPYNAQNGSNNVAPSTSVDYEHGTHVAGIVSGVTNNGRGISGVSYNANVMPVRVTDSRGQADTATLLRAYDYVMGKKSARNVRVVNLSMSMVGTIQSDDALLKKMDEAYAKGIVTVAAAGNSGTSRSVPYESYPGDYQTVVSVINLQQTGTGVTRASASNYNKSGTYCKKISAPGTNIYSTVPTSGAGTYAQSSGTSMAAPQVSGVLALMFAANPSLSSKDAMETLYATATDLGASGWDDSYGFGEVNAYDAVYGAVHGVDANKLNYVRRVQDEVERSRSAQALGSLRYRTHVQSYGWQSWKQGGETSGTVGKSKRLEGIELKLNNSPYSGSIQYRTHVQTYGWQSWQQDGATSGTVGKSKRLEAIQIRLTGDMADRYDVYYRVHAQQFGWMGWAKNGEYAGTAGYSYRLEGIEVQLVNKGYAAPGSTQGAFRFPVSYRTHVQRQGWQSYVKDGHTSGTSGKSLRLEGINIKLDGTPYAGAIQYRTHVQRIGWQGWRQNGAFSGTSGRSLRLEAIQIMLTGDLADRYDVYYRVHAQKFGWMGWAKNGESAGTAGFSYRLEGIQIRLVEKGASAPGSTDGAFRQR